MDLRYRRSSLVLPTTTPSAPAPSHSVARAPWEPDRGGWAREGRPRGTRHRGGPHAAAPSMTRTGPSGACGRRPGRSRFPPSSRPRRPAARWEDCSGALQEDMAAGPAGGRGPRSNAARGTRQTAPRARGARGGVSGVPWRGGAKKEPAHWGRAAGRPPLGPARRAARGRAARGAQGSGRSARGVRGGGGLTSGARGGGLVAGRAWAGAYATVGVGGGALALPPARRGRPPPRPPGAQAVATAAQLRLGLKAARAPPLAPASLHSPVHARAASDTHHARACATQTANSGGRSSVKKGQRGAARRDGGGEPRLRPAVR
jgi:hypothetical protein